MQKEIKISYNEFDFNDLLPQEKDLLEKAAAAAGRAYAPYSKFKVGAAVLLENGHIYLGNNQENAAYPSGLCAERVAIFSAMAQEPDIAVKMLAITAQAQHLIDHPISPCGACRQVILEYEHRFGKDIRILLRGETGKVAVFDGITSLLPFQFTSEELPMQE